MRKNLPITKSKQKDNLLTALLGKESFFLAIISIMSFLIPLAYEAGRLHYYNVPTSFIQINPVTIVIVFTVIFVPLLVLMLNTLQGINELTITQNLFVRAWLKSFYLSFPFIFVICVFFEPENIYEYLVCFSLSLIFLVFYTGLPLLSSLSISGFNKDNYWKNIHSIDSFLSFNNKNISFQIIFCLFVGTLLISFVCILGYKLASKTTTYWVIDDEPNVFLVANYDNRAIFNRWDTNVQYFTNCFEVRDISSNSQKLRKEILKTPLIKPDKNNENYAYCY